MSKKNRHRDTQKRLPPDWITAGLAGAGALVAGYLSFSGLFAVEPLFCAEGSSCAVVQGSRYLELFGLSISWMALTVHLAIAAAATLVPGEIRRALILTLAAASVGMIAYITYVQAFVLQAWCLYCILFAAIALALGGRAVAILPGQPARRVLLGVAAATLLAGAGLPAYVHSRPAPEFVDLTTFEGRLAVHLAATGARLYGTYWCPACKVQIELFGGAATALPYIECDPRGANAQPAACQAAGIRAYPTWIFPDGTRLEGVIPLDRLAAASGFR